MNYDVGDRVEVIDGQFKGRTGEFFKYGSNVFPDYCRVLLDLKGRQKTREKVFIQLAHIKKQVSKMSTEFKLIPLAEIHPDPHQPRKFYDETAMNELTDSVKSKGVLQPVLIRPNGQGFILVCGERRYRASQAAGLTEIPAVIRQLSDDEALELQIIENLQRKDVHPMEEAVAFKSLREKFSIEEISHRVGKTAQFVAQRIKLCDLIEEFQQLLFANRMKLVLASQVARLPEKEQRELYREARVPKDWAKKKDWEVPSWVRVDSHEKELNQAPFKTEDPYLYPEAGACNTCQHNSHFNKLLFPELQKKRICHNSTCYAIKSAKAYQQQIAQAAEDPEVVFVSNLWYESADGKKKIKGAEELGVNVLGKDYFEEAEKPEEIESWEEFFEGKKEWEDWNEMSPAEQKKFEKAYRDEYAGMQADFEQELRQFDDDKAAGLFKKAFVVAGSGEGRFIDIRIKAAKGVGKLNEAAGENADALLIESEIADINQREARNKELDREKVYKRLVSLFQQDGGPFLANEDDMSADEWAALLFAIAENSYKVRDFLEAELKVSHSWEGAKLYKAIYNNQRNELLQKAFRLFIFDKLINLNECDFEKRGKAAAIYTLGKQYFRKDLATFEDEQKVKATKRQNNVQARLKALNDKKQQLQAEAKPAAKPKKSKPVKA